MDGELPKAAFTSALSGSSMKKMLKSMGDVFSKIAFPMDENDRWFEQVHSQVGGCFHYFILTFVNQYIYENKNYYKDT